MSEQEKKKPADRLLDQVVRVVYAGRVQGVGFRYTAREFALQFGIRGWVRNCDDGTVEVVADGDSESLNGFLESLGSHMRRRILNTQQQRGELDDSCQGFEVRR